MTDELAAIEPGPIVPGDALLEIISRAARDPQSDVGKLERLMGMYERMLAQSALSAFNADLALMLPELPEVKEAGSIKDRAGEVQSRYALWEDTQKEIKPVLARYGFGLTFDTSSSEGKVRVVAKLSHRQGHVETTELEMPLDTSGSKNLVQAYGSAISYGKRYTAGALLNLTSRGEDDDGQAAGTKLVSDAQIELLEALAAKAKVELQQVCDWQKIRDLGELPARKFGVVEKALKAKLKPVPT